jgi:hypothetical protein
VVVINFSWGNVEALIDALEESLLPQLRDAPSYDLNLICIIRGHSTLGDSISKLDNFHERDESDEQMLVFHEFIQVSGLCSVSLCCCPLLMLPYNEFW